LRGWLITHANCLDGATAALVGEACGLSPIFVEPDRAHWGLEQVPDDAPVYLADVSLRRDRWTQWQHRITYVLDHHQSALVLKDYPNVLVDQSRCGGLLMYDYAIDQSWMSSTADFTRLCRAVARYDLWKPRHEWGQNLNRLFHRLGYDWYRQRFGAGFTPYTRDEGSLLAELIRHEARQLREQLRAVRRYDGGLPYSIYGVELDDESSVNVLSHTLIERGAALVLVLKADGRLSARSDARVDAATLMEALFDGGGHPRAAGGRLSPDSTHDVAALLEKTGRHLASGYSAAPT